MIWVNIVWSIFLQISFKYKQQSFHILQELIRAMVRFCWKPDKLGKCENCTKSSETEVVFIETEINNEWNAKFFWTISNIPMRLSLFEVLLSGYGMKLHHDFFKSSLGPQILLFKLTFSSGSKEKLHRFCEYGDIYIHITLCFVISSIQKMCGHGFYNLFLNVYWFGLDF